LLWLALSLSSSANTLFYILDIDIVGIGFVELLKEEGGAGLMVVAGFWGR
jgi:hypothetical protein